MTEIDVLLVKIAYMHEAGAGNDWRRPSANNEVAEDAKMMFSWPLDIPTMSFPS